VEGVIAPANGISPGFAHQFQQVMTAYLSEYSVWGHRTPDPRAEAKWTLKYASDGVPGLYEQATPETRLTKLLYLRESLFEPVSLQKIGLMFPGDLDITYEEIGALREEITIEGVKDCLVAELLDEYLDDVEWDFENPAVVAELRGFRVMFQLAEDGEGWTFMPLDAVFASPEEVHEEIAEVEGHGDDAYFLQAVDYWPKRVLALDFSFLYYVFLEAAFYGYGAVEPQPTVTMAH